MGVAIKILALIFELAALGLTLFCNIKESKQELTKDEQVIVRDAIILLLWLCMTCIAVTLFQ